MIEQPKKNICYICYRRFPDTNFEHYSKAVSDNGYDVTIVAYLADGQQISEFRDKRKIVRIPLSKNPFTRKSRIVFIYKVIKFLKRHQFSIIHIHHTCTFFGFIKILLLFRRNLKFVYHITSHPLTDTKFSAQRQMLKDFLQCLLMDRVIVQSEELKEKLIGIRILSRSHVVPVGFSNKYFYPIEDNLKNKIRQRLHVKANEILLVYCGAIGKNRHLSRLLEAFAIVHKKLQNSKLLMIGDGNTLSEIKDLACRLHLSNNTIFTGKVPHQEVVKYLGIADIAVSYVPINENYNYNPPLKTFEYLACGLPTVATMTESNRRIIRNGYNGILVEDTPETLSKSILALCRDKERLLFLRKKSRVSINDFDFEYITKTRLVPIYESLLAAN